MNFIDYINETKTIAKTKGIKITYNSKDNHDFKSRLDRTGYKEDRFKLKMLSLLNKLKKDNSPFGLYGVTFKDFGIIARYNKKELLIITILAKDMQIKDTDFALHLKE
jgi:hypothetical protein